MPIPTTDKPAAEAPEPPATTRERFEPVAGILAILLPGAGHYYLGERSRAVFVAVGILGLFFGGMFIGGIDSVDSREDRIWFAGQALVGPIAFGVDYLHQQHFKIKDSEVRTNRAGRSVVVETRRTPNPGDSPPPAIRRSLGRMNELGTLYSAIAGMLNLIVIIDAAWHGRRREA